MGHDCRDNLKRCVDFLDGLLKELEQQNPYLRGVLYVRGKGAFYIKRWPLAFSQRGTNNEY